MFFKRKKHHIEKALCDFVEKKNDTGYIFININNDLGDAVENGADDWSPLMLMAYGYARRTAVAALYIQGIVEKDVYDYVKTFFKSIQVKTEDTVEFQEEAYAESVKFMTGYSQGISSLLVKKIVLIAEEYEISSGTLSDAELFKNVIDTVHFEQNSYAHNSDVKKNGEYDIVKNISQGVNSRIGSKDIALQFVLEELDAARQGNEEAIQFVNNSGFSPSEYEGAMQNSFEEVDGPKGPQQFLLSSVMQYSSDMDFLVNLRLQIVENVINKWELTSNSDESQKEEMSEESIKKQDEVISQLKSLSESNEVKTCKMSITPLNEIWSWEFKFSDEELEIAYKLVSILYNLRNGDFVAPVFNIVKQKDSSLECDDVPF
jgi:hypothetical protein